jgi:hypothetical protein
LLRVVDIAEGKRKKEKSLEKRRRGGHGRI